MPVGRQLHGVDWHDRVAGLPVQLLQLPGRDVHDQRQRHEQLHDNSSRILHRKRLRLSEGKRQNADVKHTCTLWGKTSNTFTETQYTVYQ